MTVVQNLITVSKSSKSSSHSSVRDASGDRMHTFKIAHNKRKIGLHLQVFGESGEFAILTINDLTVIK